MLTKQFEDSVSILLFGDDGKQMCCSALLVRDPRYLTWNRIFLIGNRSDQIALFGLSHSNFVHWQLYENAQWASQFAPEQWDRTSGEAIIERESRANGISIAPDSIQKFAELKLQTLKTVGPRHSTEGLRAEYWFLQRNPEWCVWRKFAKNPKLVDETGRWFSIPESKLKFRLKTIELKHDDERVAQEIEIFRIPAIEFATVSDGNESEFFDEVQRIWSFLRILLTFRLRQYISVLMAARHDNHGFSQTWFPVEVQPLVRSVIDIDPPARKGLEVLLARGTIALVKSSLDSNILHAAVYGYAESFRESAYENRLTSRVEAIERIVTAYEKAGNFSRNILDSKTNKRVQARLKGALKEEKLPKAIHAEVSKGLRNFGSLSLEYRIRRMIKKQRRRWSDERDLLDGLNTLIAARNNIVHGRLVPDVNHLYLESLRAQALFEKIFLDLIDCTPLWNPGWKVFELLTHRKATSTS